MKRLLVAFIATILALSGLNPAHASSPIYPAPSASPFPIGCQYNSTPPTLSDGASTVIQCDSIGRPLSSGNASAPGGLPISATQYSRTGTTGSITSGGTAQNWAAPGAITHGCLIMNTSSAIEFIRLDGSAATTSSLQLYPHGGYYECSATAGPTGASSILGGTTGQTFYDEVW